MVADVIGGISWPGDGIFTSPDETKVAMPIFHRFSVQCAPGDLGYIADLQHACV